MGVRLVINEHGLTEAEGKLRQAGKILGDLRRILVQFGVHMVRSVQKTFDVGGRPDPWPPSKRAQLTGGKTLIDTARLKNSITARMVGTNTLAVGTNVRYAAIHQFGGTVTTPDITPVKKKALSWIGKDGNRITRARVRGHSITIPKREFLVMQAEDLEILAAFVNEAVGGKLQ